MIERHQRSHVQDVLKSGLVAVMYGARQVGKTTLARQIMSEYERPLYLNCDDPVVVSGLSGRSAVELKSYIGDSDLVVIDEGQRVDNIGLTIKLLHDTFPDVSILATGSSSLDLANKVSEPLTGRSEEIALFPFSIGEVSTNRFEARGNISTMLVRGGYPGMWTLTAQEAQRRLSSLATGYVYRDAFGPKVVYDQTVISNLLRLLAYQVGNEMSYNELATTLSVTKETVVRYIDLLEKAFLVFRRNQYRRNQRVEVGRLRKVYFTDLGIRNALIDDFRPIAMRNDIGALWENFCVIERLKWLAANRRAVQSFYWRNNDRNEIDLIEEEAGETRAFECKYNTKAVARAPRAFVNMYPAASFDVVNPESVFDLLLS